ncbi:MAG: OsmC family protein [Deltaproteobacteria bacterium]|nr:OsmC family protein [Deltaproteobacteria bacterium]
MSEHRAKILWQREGEDFSYSAYCRDHKWEFPGDVTIPASAASAFLGSDDRVDPEEAFVASIASCHMLTFLAIASRKRLVVDSYQDEAKGFLEKNERGALAVTRVILKPTIEFDSATPVSPEQLAKIHQLSHKECFIANSVKTSIVVETPTPEALD